MNAPHEQIQIAAYLLWEARGRSDGTALQDWLDAEFHMLILNNYEPIIFHWMDGPESKKIILGDEEDRRCRFCKRAEPEVTFKNEAHSVPRFLGNRKLLSADECDDCNKYFSENHEDHLARLLKPLNTLFGVKGRKGVPVYKNKKGLLRRICGWGNAIRPAFPRLFRGIRRCWRPPFVVAEIEARRRGLLRYQLRPPLPPSPSLRPQFTGAKRR